MNAAEIAATLGGQRREGRNWRCRCPLHGGVSLTLRDGDRGRLLVSCWAGCDRRDVLAELRRHGLLDGRTSNYQPRAVTAHQRDNAASESSRTACALDIWREAQSAKGTIAETYLRSRSISLHARPESLRFHPSLKHPSGGIWPALIALVTRGSDNLPLAVHRTFLARDGKGKAPVDPQKMMLGPCHGGAVRLGLQGDVLMVGEGIETCLAAMWATGNPSWAALSTSGLRALHLPEHVRNVIVLADGDNPGEAAARDCAQRWNLEGRRVRIARPPRGMDFNDVLAGVACPYSEQVHHAA